MRIAAAGLVGLAATFSTTGSVASGTVAMHALPVCATRVVVLTVATNGATGRILIYVELRNRGRRACLVRGRASLSLRDAGTHRLLHVHGNPYTKTVRARLRRGRNGLFTLQWQNYCGPGKPMLIVASFDRRQAVEHDPDPGARCALPDVPSQLHLVHLPG